MPAKVFFDTSVLVYALTQQDPRAAVTEDLLTRGGWLSIQVLNEFVAVARRKLQLSWQETLDASNAIRNLCEPPLPTTIQQHDQALQIARSYKFQFYDSLIVAAAIEAGCTTLFAEDMQHGQSIGSLRIVNPFRKG